MHARFRWLLFGLALLPFLLGCRDEPLRAGVASLALDAPVGTPLGGYGRFKTLAPAEPGSPFADTFAASTGIHTAPTARALALESGPTRVVLVRAELCLITSTLRARAEAHLRELGHDAALLLTATHTHGAPARFFRERLTAGASQVDVPARAMDSYDPEIEDRLAWSVARAAASALAALTPATLGVADADASPLNHDRRCQNDDLYGPDYRDRRLTVLRLDALAAGGQRGAPLAALVHFAMHGTAVTAAELDMTTDAPGAIERAASDRLGVPVLYLQGPAGDVGPGASELQHTDFQLTEWLGWRAAPIVADAFARAVPDGDRPVRLEYAEQSFALGAPALGYRDGEFPLFGGIACLFGTPQCHQYTPSDQAVCLALQRDTYLNTSIATLRLGDVLMLSVPGEPTTGLAQRLEEVGAAAGSSKTLVLGYAQDHQGYLLEQEDFLRGGYEPSVSLWGWRFGPYLVDRARELVAARAVPGTLPPPPLASFTPRPVEPSAVEPKVVAEPADLERLDTASFGFEGGDPSLGAPDVRLERLEAGVFVAAMASPTRPIAGGPDLFLRHAASPTFVEQPAAASRTHRWTAQWETLAGTPLGTYRFLAVGKAQRGEVALRYQLTSRAFTLSASSAAATSGTAIQVEGRVEARLRFPPNVSEYSPLGAVLSHWRLHDPEASAQEGALVRGGAARARLISADGTWEDLELHFDDRRGAHVAAARGPAQRLELAPLALVDGDGNTNRGPLSIDVQRAPTQ